MVSICYIDSKDLESTIIYLGINYDINACEFIINNKGKFLKRFFYNDYIDKIDKSN